MDIDLETPVRFIPRVGPAMAEKLAILSIETVQDFLYHIPFRYDDFSKISLIAHIRPEETVTLQGSVESFAAFITKNGKQLQEAKVRDASGVISVIWFNQPFLRSIIKKGMSIRLSGQISWFNHKLVMSAPQYELLDGTVSGESLHTGRIVPIYPETEGLSSKWMRGRIHFLLESLATSLIDPLPDEITRQYKLMTLYKSLQAIHFPSSFKAAELAKKRLAFDELFLLQLQMSIQKRERLATTTASTFKLHAPKQEKLIKTLPFTLTDDQDTAIAEICDDLTKSTPMNRLLEGDVGSGKTIVASVAMYEAFLNGMQSVLLAPTQILAEQHYRSITQVLGPSGVDIRLITGATASKEPATITIGTHAVLSDTITYNKLGLVIIDEQHRFGVHQRNKLLQSDSSNHTPHLLTMTATPIPRTLAKTLFGSLDISRLTTMPSGRKKVKTWVVGHDKRDKAYAWIEKQIKDTGSQAFIICPLIEDSENFSEVKAVKTEYDLLKKVFTDLSLGLLHGKLKSAEKTNVLSQFTAKKFDILVATPVIEVGIDIPNATIMVVEGAERFGLGQLHQLRGRVGRGDLASYCLLFPTSSEQTTISRLKAMETTYDGAKLAEIDMALRGPGDLLGSRQHGASLMKIASYMDAKTVQDTFDAVATLTKTDPDLSDLPLLRSWLKKSKIESIAQD